MSAAHRSSAMMAGLRSAHVAGANCRTSGVGIQAFDGRRQVIVRPGEIRPGDWLRDLGTLRQVESVEALPPATSPGRIFVLRFVSAPGVEDLALGVPESVTVTIWRPT